MIKNSDDIICSDTTKIQLHLLSKDFDLDKLINDEKIDPKEIFLQASGYGMIVVMEKIISDHEVDVNFYSKEVDCTPLILAAASGSSKAVTWLLDHGADINLKDSNSNVSSLPLWVATQQGILDTVHLLCERDALVNEVGNTALFVASQNGHFFVVQELLRYGADPTLPKRDVEDERYHSNPMNIAISQGNIEVVALLLSHGVFYDPLIAAALIKDMESSDKLIKMLLNTKNGIKETEVKVDISTVEKLRDLMPFIPRDRPWDNALGDAYLKESEFEIK